VVKEAFNGSLRRECLSQHKVLSLDDAQQILDTWPDDFNNERPHSSLRDLPPAHFRAAGANHADRFVQHS
jgi:putative transposase